MPGRTIVHTDEFFNVDVGGCISEYNCGVVIVGGFGAIVIFGNSGEDVIVNDAAFIIAFDPFCEGELTGSASS